MAAGRAKVTDPEGVPSFARESVDEIVQMVNAGVPRVEQHIAATFSAGEIAGEGIVTRTAEDMPADLGTLLPGTVVFLEETGAGTVSRLQVQDITVGRAVNARRLLKAAAFRAVAHQKNARRSFRMHVGLRWQGASPCPSPRFAQRFGNLRFCQPQW